MAPGGPTQVVTSPSRAARSPAYKYGGSPFGNWTANVRNEHRESRTDYRVGHSGCR